jgi:hypothetical protein
MILNELYDRSPEAYQDISQDNSQPQLSNTRKTRLTLRQINKLRQMNDVRSFEYKEKLKLVKQQYAPPVAQPAM